MRRNQLRGPHNCCKMYWTLQHLEYTTELSLKADSSEAVQDVLTILVTVLRQKASRCMSKVLESDEDPSDTIKTNVLQA